MRHTNNFDLIRCFLASLVLFSHSYLLLGGHEPVASLTRGQVEGGEFAVDFFFVLSGYLITKSWLSSRGTFDFLKKRVLRIYPGYLVAVAFCIYLVGPLAATDPRAYFYQVHPLGAFINSLLLAGIVAPVVFSGQHSKYMNASLWTIPYEFCCYLMVWGLGVSGLLGRLGRAVTGAAFLLLFFIYVINDCQPGPPSWSFSNWLAWNRLFMYFLAGSWLSYAPKTFFRRGRVFAVLCGLLAISSQAGGLGYILPWAGAYCLFFLGYWRPNSFTIPVPPIDISYGIYLYAYPIQQLLIHWGVKSPTILNLVAGTMTVAMALFSWYWVESPALRWVRGKARGSLKSDSDRNTCGPSEGSPRKMEFTSLPDC